MLYIGNNFYVDKSHGNIDYSSTIRPWGNRNGIYFGETLDMHHTACLDLVARIGYPYVFQHLGACEHILRIEYARLFVSQCTLMFNMGSVELKIQKFQFYYPNYGESNLNLYVYSEFIFRKLPPR